jgi:copper chaperone CopZ
MTRFLRNACVVLVFAALALPAPAQVRPGGGGGKGGKGAYPGGYPGGWPGGGGSTPMLEKAKVTVTFFKTDNAADMLPKVLGASGVENVKVDLKTRRASMVYSGPTAGLDKIEKAGATYGVKLLSPAIVEFAVRKTGGQASINELTQTVRQTIRDVLAISSTNLQVAADLEATDWATLLSNVQGCGYELTGKSHSFLTVNWAAPEAEAGKEDPFLKALAGVRGVLAVKPQEGGGQAAILALPEVNAAALSKAAKDAGTKLGKILPGWPPPPAPPANP